MGRGPQGHGEGSALCSCAGEAAGVGVGDGRHPRCFLWRWLWPEWKQGKQKLTVMAEVTDEAVRGEEGGGRGPGISSGLVTGST